MDEEKEELGAACGFQPVPPRCCPRGRDEGCDDSVRDPEEVSKSTLDGVPGGGGGGADKKRCELFVEEWFAEDDRGGGGIRLLRGGSSDPELEEKCWREAASGCGSAPFGRVDSERALKALSRERGGTDP